MRDHSTTASTPLTTTSQHALHSTRSHLIAPTEYALFQANTGNGRRLPDSHLPHQQQQHQQQQHQQQQHHQPRPQQLHMQSVPKHQTGSTTAVHASSMQYKAKASSIITPLLSHCTVDVPLSESQVIAVTDVAESLKELVVLALGAKSGDGECIGRLEGALGNGQAIAGLLDFFSDEYEAM